MPDQKDNISVSTSSDADHLNITLEELQGLWEEFLETDNDRQLGEFTKSEAAKTWGIPDDTAYDRLTKLLKIGKLTKRPGRLNGFRCMFYKKL